MKMHGILTLATFVVGTSATYMSYGNYTEAGCYSSISGFKEVSSSTSTTSMACMNDCQSAGYDVYATQGETCYCSTGMPDSSSETSSDACDVTCPGYNLEPCGGSSAYSVGYKGSVAPGSSSSSASASSSSTTASSSADSSSSSSASSVSSSSSISSGSSTPSSSSSTSSSSSPSSSSSTSASSSQSSSSGTSISSATGDSNKSTSHGIGGGAIAGIVIGVVVALAIIGAVLVFLKRRRTQDEYYSPSSSPAGFGNFKEPFGVRPPEPAYGAGVVAVDQRLNPVMLGERRISEGSLADARDYSRKILRVANPDDDA